MEGAQYATKQAARDMCVSVVESKKKSASVTSELPQPGFPFLPDSAVVIKTEPSVTPE